MTIAYSLYEGPEGPLLLAVDERGGVVRVAFVLDEPTIGDDWVRDDAAVEHVRVQLDEYFAGERNRFDVELAPEGTPFQLQVWDELLRIPYGETISYGELARRVDRPGAARAVGAANGQNPIAIVVPCHRVVGADGSLTGFGGGLDWKRCLLDLETGTRSLLH